MKITFATGFEKLSKFGVEFDSVFVSNHVAHEIPNCSKWTKKDGCVYVENAKMILELNDTQLKAYDDKVTDLASSCGLNSMASTDTIIKEHFLLFNKQ